MKQIFIILLIVGNTGLLCQCQSKAEYVESLMDDSTDWSDFKYPDIDFTNEDINGKGINYAMYVPNPEEMIQETALRVCQQLYKRTSEIPDVQKIEYRVHDYEGISGKGGEPPVIQISFSSDYLDQQIKAEVSKEKIVDEIVGVLVHEMTHAYQQSCEYKGEGWSIIEGIADAVRYREGYIDVSLRKSGGNWTDGYKTTGFFIAWIAEYKKSDFLYLLNQSVGKDFNWTWEPHIQSIMGTSVESLWNEYQNFLSKTEAKG